MSAEEGLLRAIMDDPADDVPRLIFADWLDDLGQCERADLIRAHVEFARLSARHEKAIVVGNRAFAFAGVPPELQPLRLRIETLINRLFRPSRMHVRSCTLRRGLIEQADLRFPSWDRFAPHFRSNPVSSLWLTSLTGRGSALVASGALQRSINVSLGELSSGDVRRVAEGPPMTRLRFLGLHQQKTEDVIRLLASQALPTVRALELGEVSSAVPPEPASAGFTFRAKSFSVLAPAILALVAVPRLSEVRRLRLASASWRVEHVEALAASAHLANLEELELPTGYLDDDRLAPLLRAKWLWGLKKLDLRNNRITGAGALMLASCPALEQLTSLAVMGNRITLGGWRRLEERFGARLAHRSTINATYAAGRQPFVNPV